MLMTGLMLAALLASFGLLGLLVVFCESVIDRP